MDALLDQVVGGPNIDEPFIKGLIRSPFMKFGILVPFGPT